MYTKVELYGCTNIWVNDVRILHHQCQWRFSPPALKLSTEKLGTTAEMGRPRFHAEAAPADWARHKETNSNSTQNKVGPRALKIDNIVGSSRIAGRDVHYLQGTIAQTSRMVSNIREYTPDGLPPGRYYFRTTFAVRRPAG